MGPSLPRLIDFFRYYSRDFLYNTGVASIRAGLIKKDSKGWQNEVSAEFIYRLSNPDLTFHSSCPAVGTTMLENGIDFA